MPLQIAAEVHLVRWDKTGELKRTVGSAELLAFSNYLREVGGYYLVDRHAFYNIYNIYKYYIFIFILYLYLYIIYTISI